MLRMETILLIFLLILFLTSLGLLIWCFTMSETTCVKYVKTVQPNFNPQRELLLCNKNKEKIKSMFKETMK